MAQLFVQDDSRLWAVHPLTAEAYRLLPATTQDRFRRSGKSGRPRRDRTKIPKKPRSPAIEPARVEALTRNGALLLKQSGHETAIGSSGWAMLTGADTRLRINGVAISIGIATLRHRDEVCLDGGAPLYFSTERLVRVETFGGENSTRCPRCTLPVEIGDLSVRCPACDITHHQRSDRECWTYSETCTLCDHPSDLATGYRWSPEEL